MEYRKVPGSEGSLLIGYDIVWSIWKHVAVRDDDSGRVQFNELC